MEPLNKSLNDYLKVFEQNHPNRIFLFDENTSYTSKEIYLISHRLALDFSMFGMEKGDYVSICVTRSIETTIIFFALQIIGAVAVLCDPHLSPSEYIKTSGVNIKVKFEVMAKNDAWFINDKSIEFTKENNRIKIKEYNVNIEDPAVVIFTTGSTGKSKGVILSQFNYLNHNYNFSTIGGHSDKDIGIQLLPIYHVFGLTQIIDNLCHMYPLFFPKEVTPEYVCSCIEKYKITNVGLVPSFALTLAEIKLKKGYNTSSLRVAPFAGAPSTKEQFMFIQKTLGVKLMPVYGLSECIGIAGSGPNDPDEYRASSVGKLLPMSDVAFSSCGEIFIKSPIVFIGYVGEKPVDRNEYFHTGDVGYLDEKGYLHITGRIKDIIIRNGNNLSSLTIENKLMSLSFVKLAAVIGVQSKKCGEVPVALISLNEGSSYDEEAVKKVLTKLEMPTIIKVVSEMPLTNTGKIDKQLIKRMFS